MNIPTKQSLLARPKYPPALQLTERDVEILQAVWTFRFLSANQVVALLGGSEQAIKNRLRQLFKARYLDRPREQMTMRFRDGYPDIVYAIGDRGSRVLVEQLGLDLATTRWEYRNRSVQERFLRHTLSVSNFLIALILATAKRRDVILLDWQREGQELRNRFRATTAGRRRGRKKSRLLVNPDAYCRIRVASRPDSQDKIDLLYEADRGTQTHRNFVGKLKRYWEYFQNREHRKRFGIDRVRVLVTTTSEARKENLRRVARQVDPQKVGSLLYLFTVEKNININAPETILSPIWLSPADQNTHSILE